MLSTLYMAAFAFKYWFHDVPFYRCLLYTSPSPRD